MTASGIEQALDAAFLAWVKKNTSAINTHCPALDAVGPQQPCRPLGRFLPVGNCGRRLTTSPGFSEG